MARTENPRRHSKFYAEYDMVTILVDDCLFRVPKRYLQQHSDVFASMFALPQSDPQVEGQSEETPIRLDGAPLEEFEALLDMIYAHEFGHQSSNHGGLTRLAAATRWESPAFRQQALDQLARSNDAVAQLVASRRFEVPEWRWPALFTLCMREQHFNKEDISSLTPEDLVVLMTAREILSRENITVIFKKEERVRTLLCDYEPDLLEPKSSSLRGPRSGFRTRFVKNQAQPLGTLDPKAPFVEKDGTTPTYVGSAYLDDGAVIPCKVVVQDKLRAFAPYHGEKAVEDFSILHVDLSRMEWIVTSNGEIPVGREPVEGGWEPDRPRLFHSYGDVGGVKVPGKTSTTAGYAKLAWVGGEEMRTSDYFILVWQ
jgi:hypothetical protein